MNQASPFVISEFKNPSGKIVFRVSGQLDGKRVRKNFSTRAEVVTERKVLEIARVPSWYPHDAPWQTQARHSAPGAFT